MSAATTVWVDFVPPEIAAPPRSHWYDSVAPAVCVAIDAVSTWPTVAVPLMTGVESASLPTTVTAAEVAVAVA